MFSTVLLFLPLSELSFLKLEGRMSGLLSQFLGSPLRVSGHRVSGQWCVRFVAAASLQEKQRLVWWLFGGWTQPWAATCCFEFVARGWFWWFCDPNLRYNYGNDNESFLEYARDNMFPYFHPVGTCRMGQGVEDSVVSADDLR